MEMLTVTVLPCDCNDHNNDVDSAVDDVLVTLALAGHYRSIELVEATLLTRGTACTATGTLVHAFTLDQPGVVVRVAVQR